MAQNDFIKIDTGSSEQKFASLLVRAINGTKANRKDWEEVFALMDHMHNGSVYTTLEALFGLPTGAGAGAVTIATGMVAAFDVNAVNTVTGGRVG